jgi:predicted ATPase
LAVCRENSHDLRGESEDREMASSSRSDPEDTGLDAALLATPFEVQTKWHVITGAQSCGKTTLINLLAARGYKTVAECARQFFEREFARGRTLEEMLQDPVVMEYGIAELRLATERGLPADEVLFLDRGLPDLLTFFRFWSMDPNEILPECFRHQYASVFVLDRLPIQRDGLRIVDEGLAAHQDEWLPRDYAALGYQAVRVPVRPPEERVRFVLESLAEQELIGR